MAPDPKMNFTEKIRSIETQPVAWNKPVVWENVAAHLQPERRSHWLVYAATFVLVLISFSLYYTPDNSPKEQQVESSMPEPLVKDNLDSIEIVNDVPSHVKGNRKMPVVMQTTESLAIQRIDSSTVESTPVESAIISYTDSIHFDAQVETDLHSQHSGDLLSTATTSKVEPIIGIMEIRVVNQSTRSKRKKLLQRMPVDERTKSEEITTGIIIARLK
jgi:hypothetical protein